MPVFFHRHPPRWWMPPRWRWICWREAGVEHVDGDKLRRNRKNLMVTPRDIDQQIRDLSKVVGYGINWALQDLEIEEINALLS